MIPIPPQVMIYAAQYGTKILAGLILAASIVAGYYYWKHEVATEEHDKVVAECNQSREKFRIDAEHFKLARQEEVDKLKNDQDERLQNAIKTYIAHYESQRNTPAATSLRVKADCAISTGSNTLPGTDQSGPKTTTGIERSGEAELSERNLRQLNEVIHDIDNKLKLKCEQVLNSIQ